MKTASAARAWQIKKEVARWPRRCARVTPVEPGKLTVEVTLDS